MPACSAPNCKNRLENGIRLFRLPSDEERRRWWLENSGRSNWQPTDSSRFCELHFEDSQFESRRADGWRKLKPNAVPTIFGGSTEVTNMQSQNKRDSIQKIPLRKEVDSLMPNIKQSDVFEDTFSNNEDCDFLPNQQAETVMRQIPNVAQWVVDHAYVKETVDHIRLNNNSPTEVIKENHCEKKTDQQGSQAPEPLRLLQVPEQDDTIGESLRGQTIQRNHGILGWRRGVIGLKNPFVVDDLGEEETDVTGDSSKERDKNESQQNCKIEVVGVKSLRGKGSTNYYIKGANVWKPVREPVVQLTPLASITNEHGLLNCIKPNAGQVFSEGGFRNGVSQRRGRGGGRRGRGRGISRGIVREQQNTDVKESMTQRECTEGKANIGDIEKEENMEEQQMELPERMQQALSLRRVQRIRGRRGRPRGRGTGRGRGVGIGTGTGMERGRGRGREIGRRRERGRGRVRGSVHVHSKVLGTKSFGATSSHVGLLKLRFYRRRGRLRGRGRGSLNVAGTETGIIKHGSVDLKVNRIELHKSETRLNVKRGGVFVGLTRRGGRRGRGRGRGRSLELRVSERLKDRTENIYTADNAMLCEPIIHDVQTNEPNNLQIVDVSANVDVNANGIMKELVGRGGLWGRGESTRGRKRGRGRPRGSGRSLGSGREEQKETHLREAEPSDDSDESSIFGSNEAVMDREIKTSLYGDGCKYPCSFCGMAFATPLYVEVHSRLCAMAPGKGAYCCDTCERLYLNADDLAAHKTSHVM